MKHIVTNEQTIEDKHKRELALSLMVIFALAVVIVAVEYYVNFLPMLFEWAKQYGGAASWIDEIILSIVFLGFALVVFLYRRLQTEIVLQRVAAAALGELSTAYDATIESWADALERREEKTEGHSTQVAEMTLHLASLIGIDQKDLIHIRRGALLHDIGKMGVPDSILHKPGAFIEQEWVEMKKHPTYAYKMLASIEYLRMALDIPYCHHEKWDGTGYPRGLKGEQIPLAARIFAIVDVYDALTSDRPHRKAWTQERTLEHIRSLSGTHFDPQVVKVFLASGIASNHEME